MNRHVLALLCALAVASPALGGLASAYAAAPPPTVEWTFGVYGTLGATAVNSQGRLIVASTSDDWIYITEIGADGQPLRQYTELSPGTTITAIALDHKDNVYVVGYTRDFYFNARGGVVDEHPTTKIFGFFDLDAFVNAGVLFATGGLYTPGVKGILSSSENGFLFKVSADLTRRLYGTFLGGDGNIGGFGSPFPGSNFIVKKITGIRIPLWVNPGNSRALAVAVQPGTELAYIGGWTESSAFPTTITAFQPYANSTFFLTDKRTGWFSVIQTNPDGPEPSPTGERPLGPNALYYSTYISSACPDEVRAVAVDPFGTAYVGGYTIASYGAGDAYCGAVPVTSNAVERSGNGFLVAIPPYHSAQVDSALFATYVGDGVEAIQSGYNGAFDLITRDDDTQRQTLIRGRRGSGTVAFVQRYDLGTGRHATMTSVPVPGGSLPFPLATLLFYNTGPNAVAAAHVPGDSFAGPTVFFNGAGAQARSIAADTRYTYLGVHAAGSQVVRLLNDLNPSDDWKNRVTFDTPGDIWQRTTNRVGAFVTFTISAKYQLTGSAVVVSCDRSSGGYFPVGRTTVRCHAPGLPPDVKGNAAQFEVIVYNAPNLDVPSDVVAEAYGPLTTVHWGESRGWDAYGPTPTACSHQSPMTLPVGWIVVVCRTQVPGTSDETMKTFRVTVADTTAPQVSTGLAVGTIPVEHNGLGAYRTITPTAFDLVGVTQITCRAGQQTSSVFPWTIYLPPLSSTTVTCEAQDAAGNRGVSMPTTFTLDLGALRPPVIQQNAGHGWWPVEPSRRSARRADSSAAAYLTRDPAACDAMRAAYAADHPGYNAPGCLALRPMSLYDAELPLTCVANGTRVELDATARAVPLEPIAQTRCWTVDSHGQFAEAVIAWTITDAITPPEPPFVTFVGANDQLIAPFGADHTAIFYPEVTAYVTATGEALTVRCTPESGSSVPWSGAMTEHVVECRAADRDDMTMGVTQFVMRISPLLDAPPPLVVVPKAWDTLGTTSSETFLLFPDYITWHPMHTLCSLDEAPFTPCEPGELALVNLRSGEHRLRTRTVNAKGDAHYEFTWTTSSSDDGEPPVFAPVANIIAEAQFASGAYVLFPVPDLLTPLPDGHAVTCAPQSGSLFAFGTTTVTCVARDAWNREAKTQFSVAVVDTTAPKLLLPGPLSASASSPSGTAVPFVASALDLVDGSRAVNCTAPATFSVGVTTVACQAADTRGNTAAGQFTVTVTYVPPPPSEPLPAPAPPLVVKHASASPGEIWPPNGKMVAITVTLRVESTSPVSSRIVSITGDDGATVRDWEITGPLTARVRADRTGRGKGRTYTMTVENTTRAGHSVRTPVTVRVPHDKGK